MKEIIMALAAFVGVAISIPVVMVLLAFYAGSTLIVVLTIMLSLASGVAASYIAHTIYEYVLTRKRKRGKL